MVFKHKTVDTFKEIPIGSYFVYFATAPFTVQYKTYSFLLQKTSSDTFLNISQPSFQKVKGTGSNYGFRYMELDIDELANGDLFADDYIVISFEKLA